MSPEYGCAEGAECGYLATCPDCDRCDDCCACGDSEPECGCDECCADAEPRLTAFSDLPGGGVCHCLNPDSPVVCSDCPEVRHER
jgi:hypothetical protein